MIMIDGDNEETRDTLMVIRFVKEGTQLFLCHCSREDINHDKNVDSTPSKGDMFCVFVGFNVSQHDPSPPARCLLARGFHNHSNSKVGLPGAIHSEHKNTHI